MSNVALSRAIRITKMLNAMGWHVITVDEIEKLKKKSNHSIFEFGGINMIGALVSGAFALKETGVGTKIKAIIGYGIFDIVLHAFLDKSGRIKFGLITGTISALLSLIGHTPRVAGKLGFLGDIAVGNSKLLGTYAFGALVITAFEVLLGGGKKYGFAFSSGGIKGLANQIKADVKNTIESIKTGLTSSFGFLGFGRKPFVVKAPPAPVTTTIEAPKVEVKKETLKTVGGVILPEEV